MSPGFLALAARANWVDHIGYFDANPFRGDTIVGSLDVLPAGGHLKGWRCADCMILLLKY